MANPTITLTGRMGQDPAPIGSGIRLRIATSDRIKDDSTGKWSDGPTSWWTVKAWGKLAEDSKDILKKGQEVTVTGKIYEETWTDNNGIERISYEIKADTMAVTTWSLNKNLVPANAGWDMDAVQNPF